MASAGWALGGLSWAAGAAPAEEEEEEEEGVIPADLAS